MVIPIKRLNSSIWFIDEALTGIIISGRSRSGSNDNEGVLHISQGSMSGV